MIPDELAEVYRDGKASMSRRAVIDRHYETIAVQAISDGDTIEPAFHWLVDPDRPLLVGTVYKRSILAELGRLNDHEEVRAVAQRICEIKPRSRDAIAMIRRARLGREAPATTGALTQELLRAVNAYRVRHPSAPLGQIRREVQAVLTKVDRAIERADERGV